MESHRRALGFIYIGMSALHLLIMFCLWIFVSVFIPLMAVSNNENSDFIWKYIIPFSRWLILGSTFLIGIPGIVAGWGLLKNKSWAPMIILILGCVKLIGFPIGTAIGAYSIWFYAQNNQSAKLSHS